MATVFLFTMIEGAWSYTGQERSGPQGTGPSVPTTVDRSSEVGSPFTKERQVL